MANKEPFLPWHRATPERLHLLMSFPESSPGLNSGIGIPAGGVEGLAKVALAFPGSALEPQLQHRAYK